MTCKRDLSFIRLLNREQALNYHGIARCQRTRRAECGKVLLYQLVGCLAEMDEIRYGHLFVDGIKSEANADKYSFVWKKSTTKYEAWILEKLDKLLPELCERNEIQAADIKNLLSALEAKLREPAVHGRLVGA